VVTQRGIERRQLGVVLLLRDLPNTETVLLAELGADIPSRARASLGKNSSFSLLMKS